MNIADRKDERKSHGVVAQQTSMDGGVDGSKAVACWRMIFDLTRVVLARRARVSA